MPPPPGLRKACGGPCRPGAEMNATPAQGAGDAPTASSSRAGAVKPRKARGASTNLRPSEPEKNALRSGDIWVRGAAVSATSGRLPVPAERFSPRSAFCAGSAPGDNPNKAPDGRALKCWTAAGHRHPLAKEQQLPGCHPHPSRAEGSPPLVPRCPIRAGR